jgi:hypothetical protein
VHIFTSRLDLSVPLSHQKFAFSEQSCGATNGRAGTDFLATGPILTPIDRAFLGFWLALKT